MKIYLVNNYTMNSYFRNYIDPAPNLSHVCKSIRTRLHYNATDSILLKLCLHCIVFTL